MLIHRAGQKQLFVPGGSLGVRACSAGEIGGGGVTSPRSVQFDGVNDYIVIPDAPALDVVGAISISLWLKSSTLATVIVYEKRQGDNTNIVYGFALNDGVVNARFYVGALLTSANYVDTAAGVCNGAWRHLLFTHDGVTTGKVYVDGVISGTNTSMTPASVGNSADLYFGCRGGSSLFAPVLIDDFRLFNATLGPTDAANLYAGDDTRTGVVEYWPFEEGTGTTTAGVIGGNSGTLTNGPTWSTDVPAPLA